MEADKQQLPSETSATKVILPLSEKAYILTSQLPCSEKSKALFVAWEMTHNTNRKEKKF